MVTQRKKTQESIALTLGPRLPRTHFSSAQPRGWHLYGLMLVGVLFLLSGLMALGERSVGVLGVAFGPFLIALGYYTVASRNQLVLDPRQRSWTRERGMLPWLRRTQGHYTDIHLHFAQEEVRLRNSSVLVWITRVVWQSDSEPSFVVASLRGEATKTDRASALADAKAFAAQVGLSLTED